jgi:sulfopyruvate decarboxylase TPP-binding subunit
VNDLLDTEEDMVDLYLTSKIMTGHRRQTHEHVEAELLLEMHARQLQKILNECSMVADKIEATEQQVTVLELPLEISFDIAAS